MVTNGVSPCSVMSFFCGRSRPDEQPSEAVDINEVKLEEARSQKQKEDQLFKAIRDKNIDIIRELIANGLNVQEIRERQGKRTVLHCLVDTTCTEDDLQQMFELFLSKGCSVDAIDEYGNTPVKLAAEKENIPLIRLLKKEGAHVNIPDELSGNTPLHMAAMRGKLQAVNLLIKYKATIDIQNKLKKTPLHFAVEERHKNVVLLLLHYKANRTLRDEANNLDPLTYANMDHYNEIEDIFNIPEEQIENMETFLKYAEEENFADVLKLFQKKPKCCDGIMEKVEPDSPPTNVEPNVNNYYTVNVGSGANAVVGPNSNLNINSSLTASSSMYLLLKSNMVGDGEETTTTMPSLTAPPD